MEKEFKYLKFARKFVVCDYRLPKIQSTFNNLIRLTKQYSVRAS